MFYDGRFFTDETIVVIELLTLRNVIELERFEMLQKRDSILKTQITEVDYYCALSVNSDSDYQIHLKRNPGPFFVNNYNPAVLKAWQANLDLQLVHLQIKTTRSKYVYL